MTKKNIIVIALLLIALLLLLIGIFLPSRNYKNLFTDSYGKILERIDNKETFNIFIVKDEDFSLKEELNYYKEAYGIKFEIIKANFSNQNFNKIIKYLDINDPKDANMIYAAITKGKADNCVFGEFGESELKKSLINANVISKEYLEIDTIMDDDLNVYDNNKEYNILYIGSENKDLYKYRKTLVDDKIKSLVVYANNLNQLNINTMIDKTFNINEDSNLELPLLLRYNKGVIEKKYTKITLGNMLVEFTK